MKLRPIVIVLTMGLLGCLAGTAFPITPPPGGGGPPPVSTAEPGTLALLSVGLLALVARKRKHKDVAVTGDWEPLA